MKVRIFVNDEEPDEIDLDISKLATFCNFLKENGIINGNGDEFEVIDTMYDSHLGVVEVSCVPRR